MAATALAAVAAIGGLWASAVATYWSQQTARDQLQQSRDDAEKDERAQAVAVSAWLDGTKSAWAVHILNRSPDPVPQMTVAFFSYVAFKKVNERDFPLGYDRLKLSIQTARLGPCTELIYSPEQVNPTWDRGMTSKKITPVSLFASRIEIAAFTDRDGRGWWRTPDKGLERDHPLGELPALPKPRWTNQLVDDPVVKKAASCGGGE
ncbi:hypothetical protein ACFWA1_27205 [Streptomyces sp. NPDC060005]|uniref:hypothetical protein n=1 Tax=Streptomyces sp. NPDC060005 TaxID=3347034 RepID=UPI0036A5382D